MRKLPAVGICLLFWAASVGCQKKENLILHEESTRLAKKVDELTTQITTQIEMAEEESMAEVAAAKGRIGDLEEKLQSQIGRVALLEAENEALRSTDSRLLRALAIQGSNTTDLSTSLGDVLRILRQQELANQQEMQEMEARRRKSEAITAPIKQKISELATRRDALATNLIDLTRPIVLRYREPGISDANHAQTARQLQAERDVRVAPEVNRLRAAISQLDSEIQAAAAQLEGLRE